MGNPKYTLYKIPITITEEGELMVKWSLGDKAMVGRYSHPFKDRVVTITRIVSANTVKVEDRQGNSMIIHINYLIKY